MDLLTNNDTTMKKKHLQLISSKDSYRSQSKRMMLLGYAIRVRKNPEGSEHVYTRYWANPEGIIVGEVGDKEFETRIINQQNN